MRRTPGKEPTKMVKTTIDVPEQMWKDFSHQSHSELWRSEENDVIQELIENYLDEMIRFVFPTSPTIMA